MRSLHPHIQRLSFCTVVLATALVATDTPRGQEHSESKPAPGIEIPKKTDGTLRVIVSPGLLGHFLFRGKEMGFEHDLLAAFAREQDRKLTIVTPPSGDDVIPWLLAGWGDIAAGRSPRPLAGIRFAEPHLQLTSHVVTRSDGPRIESLGDVAGREVVVRRHSPEHDALRTLNRRLDPPVHIRTIGGSEAQTIPTMALLERRADLVIADDPQLSLEAALHPGRLRVGPGLGPARDVAWAVRAGDETLLRAINDFHARTSRNGLRKIIYEKYFVHNDRLRGAARKPGFTPLSGRLSRYDDLIIRHARRAGLDWRLVAALIFEESRFDHDRVSPAGARGLMQILPIAAREVGAKSFRAPAENIRTGVLYLERLARLFADARPPDRLALVLAAYNVGPGHVRDAQSIAGDLGLDPSRWSGAMKRTLPLLEEPAFHRRTRLGYAQGQAVVDYVDRVLDRYALYSQHVPGEGPDPIGGGAGPAL